MPSMISQFFRRPPGTGWLILSGGRTPEDSMQRVLALVEHAGILAAVAPSSMHLPEAETVLQGWMDASGWEGRAVDCESTDALEDTLSEAAVALLPDLADPETYTRTLGQTDACEFLLAALDAGVVIVAEGPAAESLGEQIITGPGRVGLPALRWIPGAIVQTHFTEGQAFPDTLKRKDRYRIGIPSGVLIAMGPREEREIWGEGKPTITFREWWKA